MMVKFLLALLCMTLVEFRAPETEGLTEDSKIARHMICDMGFWYDGRWARTVEIASYGVEVQANPAPGFKFKISNEKIRELLEQVDSPTQKTFIGCELSSDYPNILQYMEVSLKDKDCRSYLKGKTCSFLSQTKYYPQYFAIELRLPEMEVDIGDLIIQKIHRGQIMGGTFDTVKKQKISIGRAFVLCTSPVNTRSQLCDECHELRGNKWRCELRLWNARIIDTLLDQSSPESQFVINHRYTDTRPIIENTYTHHCLYRTFKVPIILQKHTEAGKIRVEVKFDEFSTLPFYFNFNGDFVPVNLSLTYPEIILV